MWCGGFASHPSFGSAKARANGTASVSAAASTMLVKWNTFARTLLRSRIPSLSSFRGSPGVGALPQVAGVLRAAVERLVDGREGVVDRGQRDARDRKSTRLNS